MSASRLVTPGLVTFCRFLACLAAIMEVMTLCFRIIQDHEQVSADIVITHWNRPRSYSLIIHNDSGSSYRCDRSEHLASCWGVPDGVLIRLLDQSGKPLRPRHMEDVDWYTPLVLVSQLETTPITSATIGPGTTCIGTYRIPTLLLGIDPDIRPRIGHLQISFAVGLTDTTSGDGCLVSAVSEMFRWSDAEECCPWQ